ncbi:hypothetical protein E3T55_18785 [Cryobacterium frigoriphilum]|uniref:Uncharacterized protein n=1 Tax=Cryobacterium frigoriphilum TaxID=1259150 RepID=A0A4R8ZTY9_9MICO|nr:hypothetical protein [Cryobacterium frigoriphilum]TFD45383.1 hypothetical protein E3T55_18785 [Cryobacterium frigoriphilum]
MTGKYKVHLESSSGFYPCGISNPHLTSGDPDEVTCHLCHTRAVWKADPENQRLLAEGNAFLEWYNTPD